MKKKIAIFLALYVLSISSIFATYPKVALVLSGGGARGFSQIAVVDEIQKMGIPIDFICGTSMGALVGGYYAAGYSSNEIKTLLKENSLVPLILSPSNNSYPRLENVFGKTLQPNFEIGISKKGIGDFPGLLGDQKILEFFSSSLIKVSSIDDFSQLSIPFKAMATDATNAKKKIISNGILHDSMRASMSLPIIFPPYILLDGTYCMDGGLKNNLPVELAVEWGADIIISIDVFSGDLKNEGEYSTFSGIAEQVLSLITFHSVDDSYINSDLVIKPDVKEFNVLDVASFDDILERGYLSVEKNRPQLEKIRDEIAKTRELVPYETVGEYSKIDDPLVREICFIDVTHNNQKLSLTNVFDKYLNNILDEENLILLNEDIEGFDKLNNISSISYNFVPYSEGSNEGTLNFYLRDWEQSKSKLGIEFDGNLGISNNENNKSWLKAQLDLSLLNYNIFESNFNSDLKLSMGDILMVSDRFSYNLSLKENLLIKGFLDFGLETGGLSPANSSFIKNHIPSFAFGGNIDLGMDLHYSNRMILELVGGYHLTYFSPTTLPSGFSSEPISYTDPIVGVINAKLGFVYNSRDPKIFSTKGFYMKTTGEIQDYNSQIGWGGEFTIRYSLPLTSKDTLKFNYNFGISEKNDELISSYYDLGGYGGMPGFSDSFLRRGYSLLDLSFQRIIIDNIVPVYFQAGIKLLTYDSYDPTSNIYLESQNSIQSTIMTYASTDVNPFEILDLGFYVGLGTPVKLGTIILGMGMTINGNFSLVLEFV